MNDGRNDGLRHTGYEHGVRHFSGKSEWLAYARWLRRHVRVSLALLPEPPRCPLKARVSGGWKGPGYSCDKVFFESLPGLFVTGNLFRPLPENRRKRKAPGILCPHGHWQDGRLHDWGRAGSVVARCIQLARMGAAVFSWDMVGYNDSCQLPHRQFGAGDPHWGLSLMSLQTWNDIRALDFLLSLPEVDPKKVGVTGASGGGTQTFTLMAVDGRVAAAAPVCMISYHYQGGCLCENAPLLRLDATNVELARLFAPKPLFTGSCTGDWTANTPKVELPAIRQVYGFYGAKDRASGLHVDADHNYNRQMREAVYGFFNRRLFGAKSARPVSESVESSQRPPLRDRMVWWGRKAPPHMAAKALRDLWRRRCETALRPHLKTAAARRGLGPLLAHTLGITATSANRCRSVEPTTVKIASAGDSLIVAPVKQPGRRGDDVEFHTTYNRSLLADRVHEILAALENARRKVTLVGRGAAGPACLLAGALSKRTSALDVDMCGFDLTSDGSWRKHFDTPCIRQVGGLATAFALVGKRPLELRNAGDAVRKLATTYAR